MTQRMLGGGGVEKNCRNGPMLFGGCLINVVVSESLLKVQLETNAPANTNKLQKNK